jgi:pyridoxamine 5'-phosphate oxidase
MTDEPDRIIAAWRQEYADRGLVAADLGHDPIPAVVRWLADARGAGIFEPNAMIVSTVAAGVPSSRMVLLKNVDQRGFVFYTNYRSRKAAELDANPACSLLFPWNAVHRQVRVDGVASRVPADESDGYFATRPRGSQIGAWASPQSQVVPDREFLNDSYAAMTDRFDGVDEIPRPSHWGGYVVHPEVVEFWQGRPGRMHDRIRFERADEQTWVVERLAP